MSFLDSVQISFKMLSVKIHKGSSQKVSDFSLFHRNNSVKYHPSIGLINISIWQNPCTRWHTILQNNYVCHNKKK